MAGLYLHIPFCKSRCIYCGFYSTTDMAPRQRYVDALCKEMERRGGEKIETVYLGGGTPSQLTAEQLHQLFDHIFKTYNIAKDAEITIECNPDDVTDDFAVLLSQLPVNRVSMGAQTFDDSRLQFLRRRHKASQVTDGVKRLRDAGIDNISIDLMYGFPDETLDNWMCDIDAALTLDVEHLSAYCLMVEEGTQLQSMNVSLPNEELERQMYEMLIDRLTATGYEHYEISNFAHSGRRSLHNSCYWKNVPYIGLGAAAHSYDGRRRSWNVSDMRQYMDGIEQGLPISDGEELDDNTYYNDRITVALRTCEGLPLDELSVHYHNYLINAATRYLDDGLLQIEDHHLRLTRRGLFVSDMVMADLMMV